MPVGARILAQAGGACLIAAAGCGGQSNAPVQPKLPAGVEARVGDHMLTRSAFARWLEVERRSAHAAGSGAALVPDAPSFRRCTRALRSEFRSGPRSSTRTLSTRQLLEFCRRRHELVRQRVLQRLLAVEWILGEARDEGVRLGSRAVERELGRVIARRFGGRRGLARFLRATGLELADLRLQVRAQLVVGELRARALRGAPAVSAAQVERFYAVNRRLFSRPARRVVFAVVAKTPRSALKALSQLRAGRSFARVARRFSVDPANRERGGRLGEVAQSPAPNAFERAVFRARVGQLSGPISAGGRLYVFRVDRAFARSNYSPSAARARVRAYLTNRARQRRLRQFADRVERKWAARTYCRAGARTRPCAMAGLATPGRAQ